MLPMQPLSSILSIICNYADAVPADSQFRFSQLNANMLMLPMQPLSFQCYRAGLIVLMLLTQPLSFQFIVLV